MSASRCQRTALSVIAHSDALAPKLLVSLAYRVLNDLSYLMNRRQVILNAGADDLDANAQQDEG
jgi:hypothetical protein